MENREMEHLDNVKNIKLAAQRIMDYGYVDYRGFYVTRSVVQQYQGKVNLTSCRKHLAEIYRGE